MEIKKIVVCGDSFCSADNNNPGHFSELLSAHGYEVINIARGGISNTAICFQLAEAIKLKASLVIFNKTDSGRIDIPLKRFNINLGLKNFIYPYPTDSSFNNPHVGNCNASTYSDSVQSVLVNRWDQTVTIPNQVVEAVKHYVAELQSFELSTVKDSWMFAHWEHQLQLAKIPYIELAPNSIGDELYEYADRYPNTLCVFHTDTTTQKIVADSIIQQIQKIEKI